MQYASHVMIILWTTVVLKQIVQPEEDRFQISAGE